MGVGGEAGGWEKGEEGGGGRREQRRMFTQYIKAERTIVLSRDGCQSRDSGGRLGFAIVRPV